MLEILTVRSLLAVWFVASIIWGASVGYDLYRRAAIQADMSADVERDLDQSVINASCNGPTCAGGSPKALQNWSNIASTYFRFGSWEIGEYALGPPLGLLTVCLAGAVALRRLRRND